MCRRCKEEKYLTAFDVRRASPDGRGATCKKCRRENPDKEGQAKHREYKFGLTQEKLEAMLNEQNRRCAICGTVRLKPSVLHVDHDHKCCPETPTCGSCTRGLLCPKCNSGLAYLGDSVEICLNAAIYLLRNSLRRWKQKRSEYQLAVVPAVLKLMMEACGPGIGNDFKKLL